MAGQMPAPTGGSRDQPAFGTKTKSPEIPDAFLRSPGLASLEHTHNKAYPTHHSAGPVVSSHQQPEAFNSLYEWISRNDHPWTGLVPTTNNDQSQSMASMRAFAPLQRDRTLPSECSTVPPGVPQSDSGYGSFGAKQSVTNHSVCDETFDRLTETQSVIGRFNDLHIPNLDQNAASRSGLGFEPTWSHVQGMSDYADRQPPPDYKCEKCGKVLKTNSEAKKHTQRHTKPWSCTVPGCDRHEGFSTPNDLDRHKRSKHPNVAANGSRYKCSKEPCNTKSKIWPRADNFRQHLQRVHKLDTTDEELGQYEYPWEQSPSGPADRPTPDRPMDNAAPIPEVLSGLARKAEPEVTGVYDYRLESHESTATYWQTSSSHTINLPTGTCPTADAQYGGHFDGLGPQKKQAQENLQSNSSNATVTFPGCRDGIAYKSTMVPDNAQKGHLGDDQDAVGEPSRGSIGAGTANHSLSSALDCQTSEQLVNRLHTSSGPSVQSLKASLRDEGVDEKMENGTSLDSRGEGPSERDIKESSAAIALNINDAAKFEKLVQDGMFKDVLEKLGYKREAPEVQSQDVSTVSMSESHHEMPFKCSNLDCPKTFPRRCELKKHEKRHDKPYGCTFNGCDKKFGSKNDWKRHENTQHHQVESWKCQERVTTSASGTCEKLIHRREIFKNHLQTSHGICDVSQLEDKLESCRIGNNCEDRFWCGFCLNTVEVKNKGLDAWRARFDHIDDHYHGRNNLVKKNIRDWKPLELGHSIDAFNRFDIDGPGNFNPPLEASGYIEPGHIFPHGDDRQTVHSRTKRKKVSAIDGHTAKRFKSSHKIKEDFPERRCCQCQELMPNTSQLCVNTHCQHHLCVECG